MIEQSCFLPPQSVDKLHIISNTISNTKSNTGHISDIENNNSNIPRVSIYNSCNVLFKTANAQVFTKTQTKLSMKMEMLGNNNLCYCPVVEQR